MVEQCAYFCETDDIRRKGNNSFFAIPGRGSAKKQSGNVSQTHKNDLWVINLSALKRCVLARCWLLWMETFSDIESGKWHIFALSYTIYPPFSNEDSIRKMTMKVCERNLITLNGPSSDMCWAWVDEKAKLFIYSCLSDDPLTSPLPTHRIRDNERTNEKKKGKSIYGFSWWVDVEQQLSGGMEM